MSKKRNKAKKGTDHLKKSPAKKSFETKLSIPSSWNATNEDRYVYAFHNNASPKLAINQISIYGMELSNRIQGGFEAAGLIRNTVQKELEFGPTVILLLGADEKVIAKKEFDLSELGAIPANAARPWKFQFLPEDLMTEDVELPLTDWSLAFELKRKHQLDLDESWEKSIAEETKESLKQIVKDSAPLKPGEVNFLGLTAERNADKDLTITLLIRNGSDKDLNLEQIPLGVKDASGDEVAKGSFKLDNFTVKSNTSKPWRFIFPHSMVVKEEMDLSRWSAFLIQ